MYKTLKRIQHKYNVSDDVWLMIERYLYENIYQDSLDWVTDKKLHKDIARISKNDVYTMCQRNYGRIMLHLLRPTKLCPHFCDIGPDQKKLFIGGVEFHSDWSYRGGEDEDDPWMQVGKWRIDSKGEPDIIWDKGQWSEHVYAARAIEYASKD